MGKSFEAVAAPPTRGAPRVGRADLRRAWQGRFRAVTARLEHEAFLIVLFAIYLVGVTRSMPTQIASDTWMTLAYGREVVHHGLPSHDTLTVWAHGRTWVDQQWLGQVFYYGLYALGGIRAVLAVNALALAAGTGLAVLAARRRGGSARAVTWLVLLSFVVIAWSSWTVRVQSLVFVLFVGLLWLLAEDSRRPSRRVFFALPLLVLWANVHGTAFLGAALIALRGATMLLERERALRDRLPTAAVLLASPVLLLASPYGFDLVDYYHRLLLNPAFSRYVTEWAPTRFGIATAPFFLLALLAAWLAGRCASRLTRFEQGTLLITFVLALMAVRSVIWFMLSALVLVPAALDGVLDSRWGSPRYRYVNLALGAAAPVVCAIVVVGSFNHSASWFTRDFPPAAADRVAQIAARDPGARIFANERFADWLVLQHPSLAGRIAFDGRFELLTAKELQRIVYFRARIIGSQKVIRGYRLLVLYPAKKSEAKVTNELLASPSRQAVYRDSRIAVISQPDERGAFTKRPVRPSRSAVSAAPSSAYHRGERASRR
jgi:hypothetical protein